MARRDYEDAPGAPAANSLVPAASVVAVDEATGRVLVRVLVRETLEETGIEVVVTGIAGTYTSPRRVMAYDDGEVRQGFPACLLGRPAGGVLRTADESSEVGWFTPEETDGLPMVASVRKRPTDRRGGGGPVAL
ncbi:NUDIX domain-containing protein [Kitasatospora sp. NPDC008115]|uniref:NUDIX domain-containing protein n=1 Tax=Kitasatospora sp. NPDC008115 TaxID=3364022 RepID=UPI0036E74519